MEEDKVEYEGDKLGMAWARTRDSGGVTSVFAVILKGKTATVKGFIMGRRTVQTQTLPRSRLIRRGKPSRIRTGIPNIAKTLQSRVF